MLLVIFFYVVNVLHARYIAMRYSVLMKNSSEKVAKNFAGYKIISIFALEISQKLMPRWRNR